MGLRENFKKIQRMRTIRTKLKTVHTQEALLALIHPLCTKDVFFYRTLTRVALLFFLLMACVIFSQIFSLELLIIFIPVGCIMYLFRYIYLEKLGNAIALKSMALRYGFSIDVQLPEELRAFKELDRRNHKHTIMLEIKGEYKGELYSIPYHFCHLHYVDKPRSSNDESKHKHYDRYCIFFKFPWIKELVLRSDSLSKIDLPVRYKSTLHEFNKTYSFTGVSEMACARLAKPITILHLLKFKEVLKKPNFIFSKNGWLCVGCDNSDLFTSEVKVALHHNPIGFYQMIEEGIDIPKMKQLFQLIHQLAEQHDDNFNLSLE